MRIFNTDRLPPNVTPSERESIYNAMDALITFEVFNVLDKQLTGAKRDTYEIERLQLGPVLTLVRRGILIDGAEKSLLVGGPNGLEARARKLSGMVRVVGKDGKGKWKVTDESATLQRFAKIVWGKPLNYHSDKQLKEFFYDYLRIPKQTRVKNGERRVSCDRDVLEQIQKEYVRAIPFCRIILKLRDWEKQCDVLNGKLSPEGRWAAGYNIGGTKNDRWSSSDNPMRHSRNAQNIDPELRRIFIPDPGYVMVQFDQKGADARVVAYKSGDENYIKAVESGDSHTIVAAMCWGFEPKRELSDREFYYGFSYRDMSKKLQHGSNYYGTPKTLATQSKLPMKMVEEFQRKYFGAFPGIKDWQDWVIGEIQTKGLLTTAVGRVRQFWDRRNDPSTWRDAISYEPANVVANLTNRGIYKVWYHLEPKVQILGNGHDAVLLQCKREDLAEVVPRVLELITQSIEVTDIKGVTRTLTIPWDFSAGHSWAKFNDNPKKGSICLSGLHENLSLDPSTWPKSLTTGAPGMLP